MNEMSENMVKGFEKQKRRDLERSMAFRRMGELRETLDRLDVQCGGDFVRFLHGEAERFQQELDALDTKKDNDLIL